MTEELKKLLGKEADAFEAEEKFFLNASRKCDDAVVPPSLDGAVKAASLLASPRKKSVRTGRTLVALFASAAAAFAVCMAIVYSVNVGELNEDMQVTVALNAAESKEVSDDGIMMNAVDFDAELAEMEFAMAASVSDEDGSLRWISSGENDLYQL